MVRKTLDLDLLQCLERDGTRYGDKLFLDLISHPWIIVQTVPLIINSILSRIFQRLIILKIIWEMLYSISYDTVVKWVKRQDLYLLSET